MGKMDGFLTFRAAVGVGNTGITMGVKPPLDWRLHTQDVVNPITNHPMIFL